LITALSGHTPATVVAFEAVATGEATARFEQGVAFVESADDLVEGRVRRQIEHRTHRLWRVAETGIQLPNGPARASVGDRRPSRRAKHYGAPLAVTDPHGLVRPMEPCRRRKNSGVIIMLRSAAPCRLDGESWHAVQEREIHILPSANTSESASRSESLVGCGKPLPSSHSRR
jgi:hypothetical protein